MGIGFMAVNSISRAAGRSATAAAAYRCGVECIDERTGEIHSYQRRTGVEAVAVVGWHGSVQSLANAIEAAEKRKDSKVARDVILALPAEASAEQRLALATGFARWICQRHGLAAIVAVHAPGKEGDERNWHAHVLLSTRRSDGQSLGEKARELDVKTTSADHIEAWRARWGEMIGVDMRSYARQGLDVVPEPKMPVPAERAAWRVDRAAAAADLRAQIEALELEGARLSVMGRRTIHTIEAELREARRMREAVALDPPLSGPVRPEQTPTAMDLTRQAATRAQQAAEAARSAVPAWRRWWPTLWPASASRAAQSAALWQRLVEAGQPDSPHVAAAQKAAQEATDRAERETQRRLDAWRAPRDRAAARVAALERELVERTLGVRRSVQLAEAQRLAVTPSARPTHVHRLTPHEHTRHQERGPRESSGRDLDRGMELGPQ